MTREQLRAWLKQTGHDLIHGEEEDAHRAEEDVDEDVHKAEEDVDQDVRRAEQDLQHDARRVLRSRVALAIVALSIFSAVAGWRASVFDERSSSSDAVFHQDLLVQQQRESDNEAVVARDITQFGEIERDWFMARELRNLAGAAGAAEGDRLAAEQARGDFEAAQKPSLNADGTVTYDPYADYRDHVAADSELGGLHPAVALNQANSESDRAVHMTGVAALFIAALVLFTLAQVMLGRRPRVPPAGIAARWTISHTLVLGGTLVATTAAVLFVLVMTQ